MNLPGTWAEGPEGVAHAVGEPALDFPYFQMHDDFGRMVAMDRRRHVRRVGHRRVLRADDRIGEVFFARGAHGRAGDEDGGERDAGTK